MPYLSTSVMEFQSLLENRDISPAEFAGAIKKDPVLAAELLAVANNLKTPTGEKIQSIEHAVVYIGRKMVSDLITAAGARAFQYRTKTFDPKKFWHESLVMGGIAELIAINFCPSANVDETYLAASLANVGKVVAAIVLPEQTDQIMAMIGSSTAPLSWARAEKKLKGVDHLLLGEIASVLWGLPEYVRIAATDHHNLPMIGGVEKELNCTEIASFANQLTHQILGQNGDLNRDILMGYARRVGLDAKTINEFLLEVKAKLKHLFSA